MAIAFIRTIILYLLLTVGIRIMGKKQVGELETVELVFTMLISDLAAVPMQDFGIPLAYGLIPILTLFSLTMLLSVLSLKSVPLRSLLCGRPSVIIDHGVILQREMAKTRFTLDELLEELRLQGVTDLSTVEYAILENSGQVSVLLYPSAPAHDAGADVPDAGGTGLAVGHHQRRQGVGTKSDPAQPRPCLAPGPADPARAQQAGAGVLADGG